uniref:Beta-1,4-galactosyltransferase n=1 Tax=Calidris pygmaea TaxID=425635 RepID=A0A8C3J6I6_9CHAR
MLRRLLERPCTLALLVGCQFAFVAYFSLGGFRNLTSLFGRAAGPVFDYSRTHDVYANLSRGDPHPALWVPSPPPHTSPLPPPPATVGPLTVSFSRVPTLEQIQAKNPAVEEGGRYHPSTCEPRSRTAVIIPHRNRETHLGHLLYYLHPFLQRQQLQYGIYVVHQAGNSTFNRAKLLNVGVKEALKDEEWDCLFLHDVDLIPENDHNLYTCDPWNPKHVSVAMNKFGYSLPYPQYFGGVSALTPDQYMKMNGFPNEYWGWGGEDDDIGLARRVRLAGMKIARPPISIGHYKMVKHKSDKGNEENPHRSGGVGGAGEGLGGPVGISGVTLPLPHSFQVRPADPHTADVDAGRDELPHLHAAGQAPAPALHQPHRGHRHGPPCRPGPPGAGAGPPGPEVPQQQQPLSRGDAAQAAPGCHRVGGAAAGPVPPVAHSRCAAAPGG